jgi:hypothetical protein
MPDGRKNNGGHPNSGRKRKADEIKLIETMDAILAPDELWESIAQKVREGNPHAQKLWASYRYGQPKQKVDLKVEEKNLPEWMQDKLDKS